MNRVVLADETILNDCTIGITNNGIWIFTRGVDVLTCATLFGDPAKTETMRFEYGDMYDELEGYTQISVINCENPGAIRIRMTGGHVVSTENHIQATE